MPREMYASVLSTKSTYNRRFVDMDYVKSKFDARIDRTQETIENLVKRQIRREVSRSRVVKALINPNIGVSGEDLPAEFGLTASQAQNAVDQILDIVESTCSVVIEQGEVTRENGFPSLSVKITAKFLDPKDYEDRFSGKPFVYKSARFTRSGNRKKNGISSTIRWMHWVLNANRGDSVIYEDLVNIAEYGIAYGLPADVYAKYSRSGRALMIKKDSPRNSGKKYKSYTMPRLIKPKAGSQNFIDEIINDKIFRRNIDTFVKHSAERVLIPRRL